MTAARRGSRHLRYEPDDEPAFRPVLRHDRSARFPGDPGAVAHAFRVQPTENAELVRSSAVVAVVLAFVVLLLRRSVTQGAAHRGRMTAAAPPHACPAKELMATNSPTTSQKARALNLEGR